jgi:hypothetical protein
MPVSGLAPAALRGPDARRAGPSDADGSARRARREPAPERCPVACLGERYHARSVTRRDLATVNDAAIVGDDDLARMVSGSLRALRTADPARKNAAGLTCKAVGERPTPMRVP